ncbi:MAG: hypothetical protein L3K24_07105 [Gammaproteobacteria bacterium]|nr:hypothetical protein [Gammaproteobacteria bacterium]
MAQRVMVKILVAACALSAPAALLAAIPLTDTVGVIGDARTGFYSLHRDDRDGSDSVKNEWRLRLRVGLQAEISDALSARARFAGRYTTHESSGGPEFDFYQGFKSGKDGLKMGQSTLDELWLNYAAERWSLRAGRMQTKFELTGVAKKSLDRNDSPNTDIAWTDGLYFKYKGSNGWNGHAIVQYNYEEGATQVRRGSLDFSDDDSRISYFAALEKRDKKATIVQQGVDVTWLPAALPVSGGNPDDYVAFVGRMAAQWPMGAGGMKFLLGGELGFAPTTPANSAAKLAGSGDTGGMAGQVTFNFIDIVPKHSVGVVLARADAGWLLSPDFKSNQYLAETRYRWNLAKKQRLEVRVRYRTDIEQEIGLQKRKDKDLYARYTVKF